jgi:integrase
MGVKVRERPKGSGVYWVFIDHKRKRKAKKIGKDKRLAHEVAKKIDAKLILGDIGALQTKRKIPIFDEAFQIWLSDYIQLTKRKTTHTRYKSLYQNHIKSQIGKVPVNKLKRSHIRNALLNIYKKGLSKSTVSTAKNVISGVIEYVIDDELIKSNPSLGVLRKLGLDDRNRQKTIQPMTSDEVSLFLNTCKKYERKWYPLFLSAFRTGMRLGEILGLQWGDVDWHSKYIHVQRSFRQGRITETKTGKTRRVDMSDQLLSELRTLLKNRKEQALKNGCGVPEGIIFHTNGRYTSQNTIRNIWKRLLRKASLSDRRLHDIRHSYSSLLLNNGESLAYVKDQLGHSSIQMTVDIYGHLIPGSNRDAVNRLDDMQSSATYTQPLKTQKPQPIEIVVNS